MDAIRDAVNDVFGNKSQDATSAGDRRHQRRLLPHRRRQGPGERVDRLDHQPPQAALPRPLLPLLHAHRVRPLQAGIEPLRGGHRGHRGPRWAAGRDRLQAHAGARRRASSRARSSPASTATPIAGKDADAVTTKISGPAGTKVTLTIESRDGRAARGHPDPAGGEHPAGRRAHRDGRRPQGRLRPAGRVLPRRARRAPQGGGEPLPAGRPGSRPRPARQRRRPAHRGRAGLEHLRPPRRDRLDPRAHPEAPRPSR